MVLHNLMPMVGVTWIDVSLPMFLGQKTSPLKLKGIKNSFVLEQLIACGRGKHVRSPFFSFLRGNMVILKNVFYIA